jgi:hypothetical protein
MSRRPRVSKQRPFGKLDWICVMDVYIGRPNEVGENPEENS